MGQEAGALVPAVALPIGAEAPRACRLPRFQAEAIRDHALAEAPREACGLILRRAGDSLLLRGDNAAPDPTRHYLIGAETLEQVKAAARVGWAPVAVYHSHLNGELFLSAGDRADAVLNGRPVLPGMLYLVLSVIDRPTGRWCGLTASRWSPEAHDFEPLGVILEPQGVVAQQA